MGCSCARSERASREGAGLLPAFHWFLAGLLLSKTFYMTILDSSLKPTPFTMPLCCAAPSKHTELTTGKPSQGPKFCPRGRWDTLWYQELQPWYLVRWGCPGSLVAFYFEKVYQPLATYNPKMNRHHTLCSPSHGWVQKNLHQDLGEPFSRNVRTVPQRRQLLVGINGHLKQSREDQNPISEYMS